MTNVGFYVTVIDHGRVGKLLGPYDTHEDALANVDRAKAKAHEADPDAHWYAFGTSKWESERPLPPGLFNKILGLRAPVPA